jgi:hypothetical protein
LTYTTLRVRSRVGGLDRYKVSNLSQSIHDHPNGIIARLSSWQAHDKVHGNLRVLHLAGLAGLTLNSPLYKLKFF